MLVICLAAGAWHGGSQAAGAAWPWEHTTVFLEADEVLTVAPAQHEDGRLVAGATVADDYYVYRQSLRLTDAQDRDLALTLPPGEWRQDESFGKTEVYAGDALTLAFPETAERPVTLHWQGCAEAGICYPPQTLVLAMPDAAPAVSAASAASAAPAAAAGRPDSPPAMAQAASPETGRRDAAAARGTDAPAASLGEDQSVAQRLTELGPLAAAALFFGFGLLLAFTPCTLPMIPIVSSMVVGSGAGPRRAFVLSLAYVLTMAGAYAALGVAAGLAGANLQAALQSPWLLGGFAALFLVLASSLFGLFELRLPDAWTQRLAGAGQGKQGGSIGGAALLGLFSALLVGPCMTAPLAGALLYISQAGSAAQGGLALFSLGLGMGLPLLAIAVFGARILPRPGPWMERVRLAFAYVMAAMAVLLLQRFLPGPAALGLWGAWGLGVVLGLLAWAQQLSAKTPRGAWGLRYGASLAGVWAVLLLAGAASGGQDLWQPLGHWRASAQAGAGQAQASITVKTVDDMEQQLQAAGAQGQWTLVTFNADWCVSCHIIEREVLGDAAVMQRLAGVQVLRPDVTRNDEQDRALLAHWGVQGPPTLMLVGPDGKERRGQRVVGSISAQAFLERLDKAGVP